MRGKLLLLPLLAALCSGCVSVASQRTVVPPPGAFADFSAPLTPGTATENLYVWAWPVGGILSVSVCDMALQRAVENGGLEKVYFADYHQDSFLGLFTKFTVTAYGE